MQNEPNFGSSGFTVPTGCRPPTRGRCPRTPGICRFGPIAWYKDPDPRFPWDAGFRVALAATPGRTACPPAHPVCAPKELARSAVPIMLLVESDKCRGLGRSPKRHRSTLKPDEPQFPRRDAGQGTRAEVRLCKTKPNLDKLGYLGDGTWEPCRAKQSQFPAVPGGARPGGRGP
jgi:hypothetical protein